MYFSYCTSLTNCIPMVLPLHSIVWQEHSDFISINFFWGFLCCFAKSLSSASSTFSQAWNFAFSFSRASLLSYLRLPNDNPFWHHHVWDAFFQSWQICFHGSLIWQKPQVALLRPDGKLERDSTISVGAKFNVCPRTVLKRIWKQFFTTMDDKTVGGNVKSRIAINSGRKKKKCISAMW